MPDVDNMISFSAVNLPGCSAVPLEDSKIAAQQEARTSAFVSSVKVPTCDDKLSWACWLGSRALQRFFPPRLLSSLLFPVLIAKKPNFRVGNFDYFGSEQCKSTASGSSGEVRLIC